MSADPAVEAWKKAVDQASAKALRNAATFIEATASIGNSGNAYADGWYGGIEYALGELRQRAAAIDAGATT